MASTIVSDEIEERKKRLDKEIQGMDALKASLFRWNVRLSDDLEDASRYTNNILFSGGLTREEAEVVSGIRSRILKMDCEREEEYSSYINKLNRKIEEQTEIRKRSEETKEKEQNDKKDEGGK